MDTKKIKELIKSIELNAGYGKLLENLDSIVYEADMNIAVYNYVINNCKDCELVEYARTSIELVNANAWIDTTNALHNNNLMYNAKEDCLVQMFDTTDVPF